MRERALRPVRRSLGRIGGRALEMAAFFLCLVISGLSSPGASAAQKIVIGTGSSTGLYVQLGRGICDAIKRHGNGIECEVVLSSGSVENVAGLVDGRFDIALVQSDVHYHAVMGQAMFRKAGPNKTLRSLFSAYRESLAVVVRPGAGIDGLAGLPGKRINIGPNGSGTNTTMKVLLGANRWAYSSFKKVDLLAPADQQKAFCANKLDAASFVAGQPNAVVEAVLRSCPAQLIPIAGPAVDDIVKRYPYYVRSRIPGGAYGEGSEDVPTLGLLATLMTTTRLSEPLAYEVTRVVFEHLGAVTDVNKVFFYMDPFEMANIGLTAPLHPGADRYLRQTNRVR